MIRPTNVLLKKLIFLSQKTAQVMGMRRNTISYSSV